MLLILISFTSFFYKKYSILFINFILLGWIYYQQHNQIPKNHFQNLVLENNYYKALIIEKGKVSENGFTSFLTEIQSTFNDSLAINTSGKSIIYLKDVVGLLPGTTIIFKKNFDTIPTPKNPYAFDYAHYLKRKKIYHHIFLKNFKIIQSSQWNFFIFCNYIRGKIIQKIELQYGRNDTTGIIKAMLLGEKHDLSFDLKQYYSKTGTMHLLAISGLHTGIIYGCFYLFLYFFTFLPKGNVFRIVISVLLLWLYASITGFSTSVCRATLMITLFQIAHLLNRDTHSLHTLSLSAFILLLINPNFLFDVGFQLSYSAVLSILVFFPYLQNLIRFRYAIIRFYYHAILISIIATIGTLPFTLYYFNSFPSLFLISNLIITPLFGFIMGLGLMVLFFLIFSIRISFLETLFFEIISLMNDFISWIYHLNLQMEFIHFSKSQIFLSYLVIINFYLFLERKKYFYLYISCSLLLNVQFIHIYKKIIHYKTSEFLIFHSPKNSIIGIKSGEKLTIFSEKIISKKDYHYILRPYVINQFINQIDYLHLYDSINDSYIKTKNIFHFKHQTIWINPSKQIFRNDDYVFISNFNLLGIKQKNVITNRYHILDSIYQIPKKGAFRLQISF
ncbi:MAG: ComEC/Rec2 family competence protein [Flavobacteriales bacterium]